MVMILFFLHKKSEYKFYNIQQLLMFERGTFMKTLSSTFTFLLIIAIQVLFATPSFELQPVSDGYKFQLNLDDPVLQKEMVNAVTKDGISVNETFVKAFVYGFELQGIEGDPALLSSNIEFAFENDAPQIEITNVTTQEIQLEGKLYPIQPLQSYHQTTKPPFAYNPASYEPKRALLKKSLSSEYVTITQIYTYRGQKSATVSIQPMSYNTGTNTITVVKEMTVNVKMDKPQVLHSWNSKAFDMVMRASYGNLANAEPESFSDMEKYLIITMPKYENDAALNKFIAYRSKRYNVKVVNTNDINGTTVDAFREFIRGEKPTFCLLVGDDSGFPSWNGGQQGGWGEPTWKSFNYYISTQTSSFNEPNPDIALGLFYVENSTQITNIVNKTIATEENLATRPKVVLAQGGNTDQMDFLPSDHCDKIVEEVVSKYFLADDGWTTHIYPTEWFGEGAKKAVKHFNEGCSFNIYNGHGLQQQQEYGWGISNLSSMTNTVYPFVLNCACETGDFDQNCVAATAVAHENGPVTMIAAYGTSSYGQHSLNQGYADGIIDKKITQNGLAFVYAVNYDNAPNYYIEKMGSVPDSWARATMGWQYHHFGDPAIETIKGPSTINVTYPKVNQQVEQNKICQIGWNSNIDGNVKIDLYKNGEFISSLSTSIDAASQTYNWTPTNNETIGSDYQIRITSVNSITLWDTSNTFSIIPEYLLVAPYHESFDTLNSGTTILPFNYSQYNDTSDVLDWLVWNGPTPSKSDNKLENNNSFGDGNYLYVEASGNNSPNKNAVFTTPTFNLSEDKHTLSFLIYMNGAESSLSLDVCIDGIWENSIFEVLGNQGDEWVEQKFDLATYTGKRVSFRFNGITGSDSTNDICIDNINLIITKTPNRKPLIATSSDACDLLFAGPNILLKIPKKNDIEPVNVMLYNSKGQRIRCLLNNRISAGVHVLPKGKLAGGLYIVTMKVGDFRKTINFLHTK